MACLSVHPKSDGTLFRVKVHYDTGASHTLGNESLRPIIASQKQSEVPIQLKTIESASSATRTIATLNINNNLFTCIVVKSLNVDSPCMPVPKHWMKYREQWSEQDTIYDNALPQILLGSDLAVLHPVPALGKDGETIQTISARLLKSVLTGKFIATGWDDPAPDIEFCDTDQPEIIPPNITVTDDLPPAPPLVQISRRIVCPTWTPDRSTIHTIISDTDSDTDSDDLNDISATTAQVHCSAAILLSNDL